MAINGEIDLSDINIDTSISTGMDVSSVGIGGPDGYSPTVAISKSGKVTTITITDVNGEHTATINDGKDGTGVGDMTKDTYDTNDNGIVDNAEKVNNHTVATDVPADAIFTDTTYTAGSGISINNNQISVKPVEMADLFMEEFNIDLSDLDFGSPIAITQVQYEAIKTYFLSYDFSYPITYSGIFHGYPHSIINCAGVVKRMDDMSYNPEDDPQHCEIIDVLFLYIRVFFVHYLSDDIYQINLWD